MSCVLNYTSKVSSLPGYHRDKWRDPRLQSNRGLSTRIDSSSLPFWRNTRRLRPFRAAPRCVRACVPAGLVHMERNFEKILRRVHGSLEELGASTMTFKAFIDRVLPDCKSYERMVYFIACQKAAPSAGIHVLASWECFQRFLKARRVNPELLREGTEEQQLLLADTLTIFGAPSEEPVGLSASQLTDYALRTWERVNAARSLEIPYKDDAWLQRCIHEIECSEGYRLPEQHVAQDDVPVDDIEDGEEAVTALSSKRPRET